jgi:hypothetical protein
MTIENDALHTAALAFVREVRGAAADVPLRVSRELAVGLIRSERYKGRLTIRDRAMAVAILLQRDAVA